MKVSLALIGFGHVGQGLASLILERRERLLAQWDLELNVTSICDQRRGVIDDPNGLDLQACLDRIQRDQRLSEGTVSGGQALDVIRSTSADIVVEATYTDLNDGEPALSHVCTALECGKHVATTNKGPVALAYDKVMKTARACDREFRFEGTVMAGTPVISIFRYGLPATQINQIKGVLNGTTNFMLTEMEQGLSFYQALKRAQDLGYAEVNPDKDVEGWDTLAKVMILSNVIWGHQLNINDVARKGITHVTAGEIKNALAQGKLWKLLGVAERAGDYVRAQVAPELVSLFDPLAGAKGATNALTIKTDSIGPLHVMGPGAGRREASYALLSDILDIMRVVTLRKGGFLGAGANT